MAIYTAAPVIRELGPPETWPASLERPRKDPGSEKLVVGWREWLEFPDLGIPGIKAKVDTGARTSALHTHDFEIFEKDGNEWVKFHLHPLTHRGDLEMECVSQVIDYREVKDSGGHVERRPFIRTKALLGGFSWFIQLSLTNRENMKFRMLLGRHALRGRFLVDPRSSYLMGGDLSGKYASPNP